MPVLNVDMKALGKKLFLRGVVGGWVEKAWARIANRREKKELSREQVKILLLNQGRHVVFAPPGTGKTELLAHRLRRALHEGVNDEDIACLTFTNRAARNMQERAGGVSNRVFIGNFHSYSVRYLRQVGGDCFKYSILDEYDAMELLREAMTAVLEVGFETRAKRARSSASRSEESLNRVVNRLFSAMDGESLYRMRVAAPEGTLRPADVLFCLDEVRENIACVADLYCQYMNMVRLQCPVSIVQSYVSLVRKRLGYADRGNLESSWKAALTVAGLDLVAREYRCLKQRSAAMDFDDLLAECLAHMVHTPIEQRPAQHAWIQVDEAQDLNECQWEILRHMLKPKGHLLVFADREQAIYSFMGASSASLQSAVKRFQVHQMGINYRSPGYLLRLFNTYAKNAMAADLSCRTAVKTANSAGRVCLLEMEDSHAEAECVSKHVVPCSLRNRNHKSAVLMRTNRGVAMMSKSLMRNGIGHFLVSDCDLFKYEVTRDFMACAESLGNPFRRMPWSRIFKMFGQVKTLKESRRMVNDIFAGGLLPHWVLDGNKDVDDYPPFRLARQIEKGRLVIFDTETTGVDVGRADIIQFAAIEIVNGSLGRELNLFLKTQQDLTASANVHGIARETLDAVGLERSCGLKIIADFIGDAPVAAHNLSFDKWVLDANLIREGLKGLCSRRKGFCSLEVARALDPTASSHALEYLIDRYGLTGKNSHDAVDDVRATTELVFYLGKAAKARRDDAAMVCQKYQATFEQVGRTYAPFWKQQRAAWLGKASFSRLFDQFLDATRSKDSSSSYNHLHVESVRQKLLRHMVRFVGDRPLYELVDQWLHDYRLFRETDLIQEDDRLVVSTVHRAKGLEFDSVVVSQVTDSCYPSFYARSKESVMEDARCLYVAMTRAKQRLTITYATSNEWGHPCHRSRFLEGLDRHFLFSKIPASMLRPKRHRVTAPQSISRSRTNGRRHEHFSMYS